MTTIKRKLAIAASLLLIGWMGYAYWKTIHLDPEGGCKESQYFSLCFNAWTMTWTDGEWAFQTLPTDEEMIERFKKNRDDFDAMKLNVLSKPYVILEEKWEGKSGIYTADRFAFYAETPENKLKQVLHEDEWAYQFWFDNASTRYVKDATSQDLAMLLRSKGYVYFRSPPHVEGGYVNGFIQKEGYPRIRWRLLPSLNGPPWPEDWKLEKCWLRQIEPQWFLSLCRDQVGG